MKIIFEGDGEGKGKAGGERFLEFVSLSKNTSIYTPGLFFLVI
jgi:hypothetical protein